MRSLISLGQLSILRKPDEFHVLAIFLGFHIIRVTGVKHQINHHPGFEFFNETVHLYDPAVIGSHARTGHFQVLFGNRGYPVTCALLGLSSSPVFSFL